MNPSLRAFWSRRQGLDGSLAGASPHDVLVRTGWMRSVGGAGPYLCLFGRAGTSREQVDRAIADGEICELPSARGCTYLVPRADYAVALAASRGHGDAASLGVAKKHLGVTDDEVDRLCDAILAALASGPLDPRGLKDAVGDAVRHLGDAGKKRGVTTTLSLGLGRLQTHGRIRRIPASGRLDQQRFSYAVWDPCPARDIDEDQLGAEMAGRFFRWIGVGTIDQLAWWAGMSKKAAKAAAAAVGAEPVAGGPELALPGTELEDPVPGDPDVRLVGSLDNLTHLRRQVAPLVDEADTAATVVGGGFGPGSTGAAPVSTVLDLPHHAIVDRGRLIGLWDYDVPNACIVAKVFPGVPDARAAIATTEAFVRDQLGDARSFSLDSPESRGERLAALR